MSETALRTFPDPRLTAADFAAGMRAHAEADDLIRGTYGDTDSGRFRGCAVGCNIEIVKASLGVEIERGDHEALGDAIGVPAELLYLQDALFEGLQGDASSKFAVAFASALRDGQDLSRVANLFLAETLRDDVLPLVTDVFPDVRAAVTRVADGCADGWQNDDRAAACAARDAARDAGDAAGAAAWAAAWAARDAARDAGAAAGAAAWAAAWAAWDAAWDAAYQRMADRLVRLIGEAR